MLSSLLQGWSADLPPYVVSQSKGMCIRNLYFAESGGDAVDRPTYLTHLGHYKCKQARDV
jgi:hypothetical protein